VNAHDFVLVDVAGFAQELKLLAKQNFLFPVTFGVVDFDFLTEKGGQMERVEGVLGLIEVFELYETVALGQSSVIVDRDHYLHYVAESTKLILQIF
jgi:hypothetical protein